MFYEIYNKLCISCKQKSQLHKNGSGRHEHHIIPRHAGGTDDPNNLTYLTVREHIIAHYLLWKIHKSPNDIRAMHMLGGRLTVEQRRITGEYCRDNNIGIYGASADERFKWRKLGITTQYNNRVGIHDPKMKPLYASMGGKAGGKSQYINKIGIHGFTKEKHSAVAKLGALTLLGRKCMFKPGDKSFIRVTPDQVNTYLQNGYIMGSPITPNKGKHLQSQRRRPVTDGETVFPSLKSAAEHYIVNSPSILNWIRSHKKPNWKYVSES